MFPKGGKSAALAILGLTVSSVSAMGAILAAVTFWLNRGKVEERADQALARAKEGNDRYDKIMSAQHCPQQKIGWQPRSSR